MVMFKLILGVLLGLVAGSVINMVLITVSGHIIALPPGVDMTTAEGISAALPQLESRHFIFPFLAHAVGTLLGAFIAAKIAVQHRLLSALLVGSCFFIGGIVASNMIPAPIWFIVVDLIGAYFPFALLGYFLACPRQ